MATTINPPVLRALGTYIVSKGFVNLGVVGDAAHISRGNSYHLGRPNLMVGGYTTSTARDKAGLSDAASAIDLGKLHGSYAELRAFSTWFVAQLRANKPGTRDVREFIYSLDGVKVYRWDRERGYASAPTLMASTTLNNSHRTHSHISFYRDSETRDKRPLFAPYFAPVVVPPPAGGPMTHTIVAGDTKTGIAAKYHITLEDLYAWNLVYAPTGKPLEQSAMVLGSVVNVTKPVVVVPPPAPKIYTEAECAAKVAAAVKAQQRASSYQVASLTKSLTEARATIAAIATLAKQP